MVEGLKAGLGAQRPHIVQMTARALDSVLEAPALISQCSWPSTESSHGRLETRARVGPSDPHTSRDHGDSPERNGTGERHREGEA